MKTLTISQVAKQAGIGIETIRFYERKGLINEPPRRKSGYREYSLDAIARLVFIRRAKDLGFSLNEIADPALPSFTDYAFGCRMYGNTGTPPRQMIESAIKERISP